MKQVLLILMFCSTIFTSVAQRIAENKFTYRDGVTYSILRFEGWKTSEYGNGMDMKLYVAKNGLTFKTALIEFDNTTDKDVIIDFEKIFLLDSKNNKYHVSSIVQAGKLTTNLESYKKTLKAGKKRKILPTFWPAFPKDEKMERLMVNDTIINFNQL